MKIYKNQELIYESDLVTQSIQASPENEWVIDNTGQIHTGNTISKTTIFLNGTSEQAPSFIAKWIGETFTLHLDLRLWERCSDKNALNYKADPLSIYSPKQTNWTYDAGKMEWAEEEIDYTLSTHLGGSAADAQIDKTDHVSYKPIINCLLKNFELKIKDLQTEWKMNFEVCL